MDLWICNAYGGTIYIDTDDDGNVVGIDNARDLNHCRCELVI